MMAVCKYWGERGHILSMAEVDALHRLLIGKMSKDPKLKGEILEYNAKRRCRSDARHVLQRVRRGSVPEEVILGVQSFL